MKRHSDTTRRDRDRRDREPLTAVRHRIEHSRHKGLRRVKATISDGTITLAGSVPTEEDRDLAVEMAGTVHFVEGVIDELEIVPVSQADNNSHVV